MKELELPDLPVIAPLLEKCFHESGVRERLTQDECLGWVHNLIESKRGKMFVDSTDKPTTLVCLSEGTSIFPREQPLVVILVYVLPEYRNAATFRTMGRLIEGQAAMTGKNVIYASEWSYGDTPEIGTLWESLGFKLQEKTFVKLLN